MAEMGLREFARIKGVDLKSVQKAIANGRIQKNANGKLDDAQLQSWEEYRDPSKIRGEQTGKDPKASPPAGETSSFQKAKLQKEVYVAQLRKLEYEEKAGKLVEKDAVKVAVFNLARTVRDAVLGIPDRVAAEAAAELSRELGIKADMAIVDRIVHRVFDRESRAVLQELSKGLDV